MSEETAQKEQEQSEVSQQTTEQNIEIENPVDQAGESEELSQSDLEDDAGIVDAVDTENIETDAADTEEVATADTEKADTESADTENVAQLKAELKEVKDKYLRLHAEFENFKRRNAQEMKTRSRFAGQGLAMSIITGLDNLERALEQVKDVEDERIKDFVKGIEMIQGQFYEAFKQNNIERVFPHGELFDPNQHEAVGVVESDEVEPDHIAQVFQAGYIFHDRVIRPATVQVVKKK